MPNKSKFDFYEKVLVVSKDLIFSSVYGQVGAILGKAQNKNGDWSYGVYIYRDGEVRACAESDIASTGEYDKRESFYNGTVIRVRVDEQGRGTIID